MHPESCQASKLESFAKIIDSEKLLTVFTKHFILDVWQSSEYVSSKHYENFGIYILLGKNLSATMPAAPKVALPRRKLLQVPLIVRYLTKLVGASSGTFCEVQKLGGCCIGFRHWSKELPKFRRNGPINALSNEPSGLKKLTL